MSENTPDSAAIQAWSIQYLARTLGTQPEQIRPDVDVDRLGLDSTSAVAYMMSLEEWLGIELMPELLFQHPTVAKLSSHLASRLTGTH